MIDTDCVKHLVMKLEELIQKTWFIRMYNLDAIAKSSSIPSMLISWSWSLCKAITAFGSDVDLEKLATMVLEMAKVECMH